MVNNHWHHSEYASNRSVVWFYQKLDDPQIVIVEPSSNFWYKICHSMNNIVSAIKIRYFENSDGEVTKCSETHSLIINVKSLI